ncbi:hypothetical protein EXIGLDRAFT_743973 [Exidia glandulosa HHB12029]|uniref:Uncharacterized protein n=1 Tax=Exidia glandulosa HHB12029 TaxID=1314781 RepID=A0A165QGB3_EXIGL|nr:hypothetical protein EXIGLDRAFT_743973 [Exidia glandulosa HHB12029]
MMLKSISVTILAAACATARITTILPFNGTFHATDSSTLTVTFSTENGLNPVFDWFATFGVSSADFHADPTALGHFVTNVDFVAIGKSLTGTGNFSVSIPVNTTSVNRGSGKYVLTAAILDSFGVVQSTEAKFLNNGVDVVQRRKRNVSVSHPASASLSFLTARFSWDWSCAIGVRPASETAAESALGTWLANVDFVSLDQDLTGNGNFTVDIPLPAGALGNNTGPYLSSIPRGCNVRAQGSLLYIRGIYAEQLQILYSITDISRREEVM